MRILGIETSCDETAASVVGRDSAGLPCILSNVVLSQIEEHAAFGGVVPELAARSHLQSLDRIITAALSEANLGWHEVDAIAATAGPGLIGGLLVGLMTGKGLAASLGKPFIAVNHLEGHALTARLTDNVEYPYLMLLVSGGHTQILRVCALDSYERWATTIDDALGEAFDKTAKLLGLPFPGGPQIEKHAQGGDDNRFQFPQPLSGRNTLDFSFSGLKTALRNEAEKLSPLSEKDIADLCASFQRTVRDILVDRVGRAMDRQAMQHKDSNRVFVAAGGVAANQIIRTALEEVCASHGWNFVAPPPALCGDNAAMIAWAGLERMEAGKLSTLDSGPRPRWPLDKRAAQAKSPGRKGVKA